MEYLISILIFAGIYAILALSLNLVVGYSGMLSVAQAAFYGIGAYATDHRIREWFPESQLKSVLRAS